MFFFWWGKGQLGSIHCQVFSQFQMDLLPCSDTPQKVVVSVYQVNIESSSFLLCEEAKSL